MITAVIPVYNHVSYVGDAIRSCLLSELVSKILIADDGSSDSSHDVIKKFALAYPDKIIDMTSSPPHNLGAHAQLNRLCSAVETEWIAILNSDDIFDAARFKNFSQFVKITKPDLIFGNCAIIDSVGNNIGYKFPVYNPQYEFPSFLESQDLFSQDNLLIALLNQNIISTTSNIIFKKDLFNKLQGFAAYRYIHDWDFVLRASCIGRVVYNSSMWTNYRIHSSNTIIENTFKVDAEVDTMFKEIINGDLLGNRLSNPRIKKLSNQSLRLNNYISESNNIGLIVSDANENYISDFQKAFPKGIISNNLEEFPDNVKIVYAPSNVDKALSANELKNLLLCINYSVCDVAVCSTVLSEDIMIDANVLRDVSIIKREIFDRFICQDFSTPISIHVSRLPRKINNRPKLFKEFFRKAEIKWVGSTAIIATTDEINIKNNYYGSSMLSFKPDVIRGRGYVDDKPIIFVFPGILAVGGAENILIELTRNMIENFTFIAVITEKLHHSQGSWMWRALEYCESIYDLAETCEINNFANAITWLKAVYRPQLIFITNGSTWQMQHASVMKKIFSDVAIIDQQVYDNEVGWIEWFDHPSVLASDRYIAVNKRIKSKFIENIGIDRDKVDLIYHPINSQRIFETMKSINKIKIKEDIGIIEGKIVAVFVGRMAHQKRPFWFTEIAKQSMNDMKNIQFVMVGQGPLSDDIDKYIVENCIDNIIRIKNVKKVEELYSVADLLVITSEYEGLPLAMLEAMAVGVPVCSTDVGDIGSVLREYVGVDVIDVNSTFNEYYDFFEKMINNISSYRERFLEASKVVAQDFSGEEISKKYIDSFEKALSGYKNLRSY